MFRITYFEIKIILNCLNPQFLMQRKRSFFKTLNPAMRLFLPYRCARNEEEGITLKEQTILPTAADDSNEGMLVIGET